MDLALRGRPELRAVPAVLHTLGLLPLSQLDIQAAVEQALGDNPMLERADGTPCPGCGRHLARGRCPRCVPPARDATEPAVRPFDSLEAAAGAEIRSDCRPALGVVLAHLTERGLLDAEPAEIAGMHGLPTESVAEAIRAIKAAGPPGIAETSVAGLLLVQARRLVDDGEAPELLAVVVRDHLDALAADDVGTVAAAEGVAADDVAAVFSLARTRLRPAAAPAGTRQAPPRPVDVELHREETGWRVEVPDSGWFGLRVAATPRALDPEASAWLAGYGRTADELVRQLDARADVLRRVCQAVVARQAGYFERGPAGHVHLTRTDIAAELGLHASTVSRAVAGKALRCPDGRVLPLADLFGGAVAVKSHLAALAPARLTDAQLCAALAARGFTVARRTVAKYRAELGIPARGRS